ncbi:MAG: ABC transporter permease [Afipia felis]|jgi:ABC-type antimicrobial peptide transport system permease subunit|uniref:ABC transporter permease n=1 Tax=Rhizobium sp. WW_1 TaxID=1907375 RepID=UPI000646D0A4|nr:ABC transporter permease [Rhizobium sp. WW_1]MBN9604648.1 ABC transporter permease [Afipia felis]RKD74827.1 ABC-type lipoprotein release transport system permease subunit [Rhizobium sp. WW_1]
MGMIVLGLRNLLRSKSRLVLIALLIGAPFFLLLAMQSIGQAVDQQTAEMNRNVNTVLQLRARGSMGHVNMSNQDRLLPDGVVEKVRGIEHVTQVEPYLLAMSPTTLPNFAMHVGLAPMAVKRLESHGESGNPRVIAGRDFTSEDAGQDVAIIGQGYAEWAGIKPEDMGKATFTVDPTLTHPVIYGIRRPKRELRVIGMYASGYVFGDLQLFMPIDTFRSIYGVDHGFSWVFAQADSVENVAAIAQRLQETVGDVADILAPKSAAVFTATTSRSVIQLASAGSVVAFILMIVVVFFVLLMQVRERAREIGTLKAIGASNGGVTIQFLTEALAFTLLGGVLGLLIFRLFGKAVTGQFFALGIGPFLPSQYKPLFESLTVSSNVSGSVLLLVVVVAVLAALIGSAYGVWQAIKLSPLEAMKDE